MSDLRAAEEILRTLVAFDTVSDQANLALITWIETYLDAHSVWHTRLFENQGGAEKASLLARIGPDAPGGIVLSGHTDVVPVKDQVWTKTTPFALKEHDGKLYGRGTADMKSFIALSLAMVPEFLKQNLKRPVWLAFSHDEEIGCKIAEPMAKEFAARNLCPSLIVAGEPTDMQVVGAHKGIVSFETFVAGREAHSSMPDEGVNAVMIMAELLGVLNGIRDTARANPDITSNFPSQYSTVHVGVMEGGTARNIIPRHARICWEVRPLPGTDIDALLKPYHDKVAALNKTIREKFPECGITTEMRSNVHPLTPAGDAPYLALASYLAGSNAPAASVSYGSEAGMFGTYGFPTIVCGPGSISQAHQPDEWVSRDQLAKGLEFLQRVGTHLAESA